MTSLANSLIETRTRDRILSDDTNSYRHFPRRSSKNCDLLFANTDRQDRFKENYSIDKTCDRYERDTRGS